MRNPCPAPRRRGAAALALLVVLPSALLFWTAACLSRPKNVPCTNDGQCQEIGDELRYCLQSRCVECVASSSCKGGRCVDGRCEIACLDDRACPQGQVCTDGFCRRL